MGRKYQTLDDRRRQFIEQQRIFFVATAASDGHVNLSPKGMDTLRVVAPDRVVWLNLTGSGNESAAHLRENDRITLMFCAFEGDPLILRVYGNARTIHPHDADWPRQLGLFRPIAGGRQIIEIAIDMVQTSCGMGVPRYDFVEDRDQLEAWARKKGEQGLRDYWQRKNRLSIDGKPTGIAE